MAAALFMSGCVDDKGNYDYDAAVDITPEITTGLDNGYTAIMLENLVIEPQIEGSDQDYDFFWMTYPHGTTTQGKRDTIGTARKLDYQVMLAPGLHRVVFQVKDKKTGVSAFQQTVVTVTGAFGTGYFINKSTGGRTDIDFINSAGGVQSNILKTINGDDLPGVPVRSSFSSTYAYRTTEEVQRTKVPSIMLATDKTVSIYDGSDMKLIKGWDDLFMETPAVCRPQGVWGNTSGYVLINDNKVHMLNGAGITSFGTFGYAYPEDGVALSDKAATLGSALLGFNETTGELVGYTTNHRYAYQGVYTGYELHHFTNQDVLWLGSQHFALNSAIRHFAVLKDKTNGKTRLIDVMTGSIGYVMKMLYNGSYEVPDNFTIGSGKVLCCKGSAVSTAATAPKVIYYSAGDNKVSYYNAANQTQALDVLTIPADEQIVYIQNKHDAACNGQYAAATAYHHADKTEWNEFLVLSQKGSGWVLRTYNMVGTTHDIDAATVKATYTGSGTPHSLIVRDQHTMNTW